MTVLLWLAAFAAGEAVDVPFDPEDSTKAVQEAVASKAPVIRLRDHGKPWLLDAIELESGQEIVFDPGVVVMPKPGSLRPRRQPLFRAAGKKNVVLRGYGASIVMRKADYRAAPYEKSEWRHAVDLRSCDGVKVLGLRIASSGGDGIYVGRMEGKAEGLEPFSRDVELRDLTLEDHHRQGISVISVDGLLVASVTVTATEGTPPAAGIDFEPNYPDERLANIVVEDSRFEANASYGLLFFLKRLTKESHPVSIEVRRSVSMGNKFGAVHLLQGGVPGKIAFKDSELSGKRFLKEGGVVVEILD